MVDDEGRAGIPRRGTREHHAMDQQTQHAYKVGRLWKFKLSEVDDWIRSGGAAESNEEKDS